MTKILNVYLLNNLAGTLKQDNTGALSFQYKKDYLENKNAYRISI